LKSFLITDTVPIAFQKGLEEMGFQAIIEHDISREKLLKILPDFEGIVTSTHVKLDKEAISIAEKLKYILRPGSGLDNIDLEFAASKKILVLNSPEGNKDAVAEHAIGLLLALLNYIPRAFEEVKKYIWERKKNTGTEIKGKIIGIIGFGNTGSAFAKKLQGFEARLLGYDKERKGFGLPYIEEVEMEKIFEEADIVSLHIPLNKENRHLVNREFISRFKKPFYLLNTSRGKIADTQAITEGLESGKILGAALDVLENERFSHYTEAEKKQFERLLSAENVLITPHIAGWTKEARERIFMKVLEKFRETI
jgi:D-3-phosphoglycerate dehydrogenase